ncbi:ABC transporter permease subunit [Chitinivibrio alkaliphilus]|uniref:ABC transporter permease, component n=1 Tax=Chitinivibrio alkaliphilus ACht1 TaxID=1313304 RepID=U7D780_9BACT|nr:ABC transporter permease subunit [Chitinivibrio alkaliphilus]ERP31421.1 ABC transporter permease, component [Chitinivibrio alkaliphilus ACht1]
MNLLMTIVYKEFKSYFLSPIAYVFISVYLILTNFLFFQTFFVQNLSSMRAYFEIIPWVFILFLPAITMRTWAEEQKNRTLELLLTWPIPDGTIVLGKFLAALLILLLTLLLSCTVPITIMLLGNPDGGVIIGSYAGAALLGASYIAIGMWISSLTENQIIAFIGTAMFILVFLLIGNEVVTTFIPSSLVPLFDYLSIATHFQSISRGVIDSRDIIYYLSIIIFFLYLNRKSLERRKW